MATKKTNEPAEEIIEQTAAPEVEPYSWEDKRTIRLPKAYGDQKKSVYVCINGREFSVPRGKAVEVPYPVYERLEFMLRAEELADKTRDEIPNEA